MPHTIRDRKPLLTRVRRIQGQLRSLEATLEAGGECAAV
ncbi:MAG: Metal-sensitive transcriptional repressor, partial [Pseudomonadota bacterium]